MMRVFFSALLCSVVERSKKRDKNPDRVGANFDRTSEFDNEW